MGWLFKSGCSRKDLITELTQSFERTCPEGMIVRTQALAHCYRGGVFSGVLWTVWERTFELDGQQAEPTQRWIGCDLLRYEQGAWGYKDLDEAMHPYYYSCPLGYLALVPLDQFAGNEKWRVGVRSYHACRAEKRRGRKAAMCS